ncbi:hypothetical protein L1987_40066 [Smallanthus sonchifolius]|uniref:Uncharacterized protein n=1 Tax=Smallanthus sonchifolius TaxID=185202 RepID=A0ACB9GS98_9ASTR|nr:hypothetical protein L1987_40066 [Smallanthus sonchifolius]
MSQELFVRICVDLEREYQYFQQMEDARRKLGFTALQKCTCAVRQLANGTTSDSWDEYLKMSEKTARDTLHMFCEGVINLYGKRYLRRPTFSDIQQIYEFYACDACYYQKQFHTNLPEVQIENITFSNVFNSTSVT